MSSYQNQSMTTEAPTIRSAVAELDRARESGEPEVISQAEVELMEAMRDLAPDRRVRALIVGGRIIVDVGLIDEGTDGEGEFRTINLEEVVQLD